MSLNSCNNQSQQNDNSDEIKGTISISGAFALYPMTVRWAEEFKKVHPKVRIDISAGGAGKGMADALSGMADLGMFSREVSIEEVKKGAWKIALTKDAVIPTMNPKNPYFKELKAQGLCRVDFEKLYINNDNITWGKILNDTTNTEKIMVFTRSDACGAADMWAHYLGGVQETLKGVGIFGDPGIADAVKKDINGVGYNNVIYVYDITSRKKYPGLEVIPIDLNCNGVIDPEEDFYDTLDEMMEAIKDYRYPAPPARDLYFVSKGKPENKAVLAFIEWILTEGQQFVNEAGYVKLSEEKIQKELAKIKE